MVFKTTLECFPQIFLETVLQLIPQVNPMIIIQNLVFVM